MAIAEKAVLVLGAGFTKGFLADAPLLRDDYAGRDLLGEIEKGSPYAAELLRLELGQCARETGTAFGDVLNLERLMTRLHGGMPYDENYATKAELALLLSKLKARFIARLDKAFEKEPDWDLLTRLGVRCREKRADFITFNYDCLLEQAMLKNRPAIAWGLDDGYGFPCNAAEYGRFGGTWKFSGLLPTVILKLHGSVNWRIALGQPRPYPIEALRHHEKWAGEWAKIKFPEEQITSLLEPDPFFVPPVLSKTALVEEPILRYLWSSAYRKLKEATQVTFLGYSLPQTDIAAGCLFKEGLQHLDPARQITVVDYALPASRKEKLESLLSAYRAVFPTITEGQFQFDGARAWVADNV